MSAENKIKFHSQDQKAYFYSIITELTKHYNARLISIVLFGSMATGLNRLNSDCDLLIILENSSNISRRELIREFSEIEALLVELENKMFTSGVSMQFSPIILKRSEALKFNPLYLDMTSNHDILYDKDNFFNDVMTDMKQRMQTWGSEKHEIGNGWYWKIKKNVTYGEKIDYDQ